MDELIKRLIGALPLFRRQMVALLAGPKTAVLEQDLESESALSDAFTFLAVSVALSYIAQIPLLAASTDKALTFAYVAILSAITFALNIALVVLSWKAVGAHLPWRKLVAATCYFCGLSTLLFLVPTLIAFGALKLLDPVGYQQILTYGVMDDPAHSGGFLAFLTILFLGGLAVYFWIIAIWDAYRQLAQVSKLRSGIALLIFTLVSPVLITIQLLMSSLTAQSGPGPVVPDDLIGEWESSKETDVANIRGIETHQYSFTAPQFKMVPFGNYTITETRRGTNGRCIVTDEQSESGMLLVHGTALSLIPYFRVQNIQNGCDGTNRKSAMTAKQARYQYQISQQPTGWTLCLNSRFPQICLIPRKP